MKKKISFKKISSILPLLVWDSDAMMDNPKSAILQTELLFQSLLSSNPESLAWNENRNDRRKGECEMKINF